MSDVLVQAPATLDEDSGRTLWEDVLRREIRKDATLEIDFSGTETMNSLGGAWLVKIAEHLGGKNNALKLSGQSGQVAQMLDMVEPALQPQTGAGRERVGLFLTNRCHQIRTLSSVFWVLQLNPLPSE